MAPELKNQAKKNNMRIPGIKTLNLYGRKFRSKLGPTARIFGYHRVRDTSDDPFSICVSPENFACHMEYLAEKLIPLSLDQLVKNLTNRQVPARAVIVTFDDGYKDVLYNALPILEKYQIPATVFISTGYLGRLFWWDELAAILKSFIGLRGNFFPEDNGLGFRWAIEDIQALRSVNNHAHARQEALEYFYHKLIGFSPAERNTFMEALKQLGAPDPDANKDDHGLTAKELVRLASSEYIQIGSHTVTHPALPFLSTDEQLVEIAESKSQLEALIGKPVKGFSFPNGGYTRETMQLLQSCGYEFACSSFLDVVRKSTHRMMLPRLWPDDLNKIEFKRWLGSWGQIGDE